MCFGKKIIFYLSKNCTSSAVLNFFSSIDMHLKKITIMVKTMNSSDRSVLLKLNKKIIL